MNKPVSFRMQRFAALLIVMGLGFFTACSDNHGPDVSGIKVSAPIARFDQYLFTKFDTTDMTKGLGQMRMAFPWFAGDFITNILGLPLPSGKADSIPAATASELKTFLRLTRPLYDSIAAKFSETSTVEKGIEKGFTYLKYYYPEYKLPRVVMYVGPFNAPGIALTNEALAIGLQLYAGKDFGFYTSETGLQMFPSYISRTFEPEYIPVNCMKLIIGDLYPAGAGGKPMIEQMVAKGKEWYLLDKFLPGDPDTLKTGFTAKQLEFCESNEGVIWNAILQNTDLYTTEPSMVQNYLGEAPTTQGMPEASPGNIGQWLGYKIVLQYAKRNPKATPQQIMNTAPSRIFAESKYKPR